MATHGGASGGWLRHPAFMPTAAALGVALLALAGVLVIMRPSSAAPPGSTALVTTPSLVVYAAGAVAHPGVYTLPGGSRVVALVQAAGGALDGADLGRVDLAATLFDGEEIYVPLIGEPFPSNVAGGIRININTASAASLHTFLGISTKIAAAIVAYRQQHGNFTSVDQLLLVPISRSEYDRIKNLVTVGV